MTFKLVDGPRIRGEADARNNILRYCKYTSGNTIEYGRILRTVPSQLIYQQVEWNGADFIPLPECLPHPITDNRLSFSRVITVVNVVQC